MTVNFAGQKLVVVGGSSGMGRDTASDVVAAGRSAVIIGLMVQRRGLDTGRCLMKAIVVTDAAAGTAGMTLVERPEPEPAINDVVVQVHASGFTSGDA